MTTSFLLVHGGSSTARFWDRLLPYLDGPALAVDLPGRAGKVVDMMELTVDECVASVLEDVHDAGLDGEVVVIAHSSGGLVVPGIVAGLDGRTRHIVLNAALIPRWGLEGAAVASATSMILWNVWLSVLAYKRLGVHSTALGRI